MKKVLLFAFFISISINLFSQSRSGVIDVNAKYSYMTYRNVTQAVPRLRSGSVGKGGIFLGDPGGIDYVTVQEPVIMTDDYNLPFSIYEGDFECYTGRTPARITGFDPGKTYTIIWISRNGVRKEGVITVPSTIPYTKSTRLE